MGTLFRKLRLDRDLNESQQNSYSIETLLANPAICENVKEVQLGNLRRTPAIGTIPGESTPPGCHDLVCHLLKLSKLQTLRWKTSARIPTSERLQMEVRLYDVDSAGLTYVVETLHSIIAKRPNLEVFCDQDLGQVLSTQDTTTRKCVAGSCVDVHVPDGYSSFKRPLLNYLRTSLRNLASLRTLRLDFQPLATITPLSDELDVFSERMTPSIHLPCLTDLDLTFVGGLQALHCVDAPALLKLRIGLESRVAMDIKSLKCLSLRTPDLKCLTIVQRYLQPHPPHLGPEWMDYGVIANWKLSALFLDGFLLTSSSPPPDSVTDIGRTQIWTGVPPLAIRVVLPPSLLSLRLHHGTNLSVDDSKPSEILTDALTALHRNSPHLDHLEMDVGHLDKLWHPTAVPGIDLDVRIYALFDQLTIFHYLAFLRLMAPYKRTDHEAGQFCQPLTDDGQAVRIFSHLRARGSRIQRLIISPSPERPDDWLAGSLDPMVWEVRELGDKILLLVRQRGRNYEHRQVWSGQRRLWTSMKKFGFKSTMAELCG